MAQPYLLAMEHSEWHAKNVLKKFHKNRPLGRIENQHRYNPPQPVLSCKTVDIDTTGTRTYRALSNKDIIEEQHKLIHEIYSKARSINSAPPGGRSTPDKSPTTGRPEMETRSLSCLKVQGQRPDTGVSSRTAMSSRVSSARPISRPSSGRDSKTSFIVLRVRPHTTGSRKYRAHAATKTRLNLEDWDPAWEESNAAYQSSRELIKRTWDEENRSLEDGKFVRGKKDKPNVSTSLDPKAGQGWMTFGGGQKDRSAGIVDAFTAVKEEDKYFSIDGSTGITVARQVQRGDKIRIGQNGRASSLDSEFQHWVKEKQKKLDEIDEQVHPKPKIMPLSWAEQLSQSNDKVIEANVEKIDSEKPNLCEIHPVVFKKFGEDGCKLPKNSSLKKQAKVKEGYGITRRTAERIGIDGKSTRPTNKVTHISVSKNIDDCDDESSAISYEDVLEMRIKSKSESGPHVHEEVSKAAKGFGHSKQRQQPDSDIIVNHTNNGGTNVEKMGLKSASRSSMGSEEGRKSILRGRPLTSNSATELNEFVVVTTGAHKNDNQRMPRSQSASGLPGTNSARKLKPASASGQSRPPPAKPVLHKTSAAGGSSIANNKNGVTGGGDASEYLHFSQQLCITKDHQPKSRESKDDTVTPVAQVVSNEAIKSVSEHNKPSKDVKFNDEVVEYPNDINAEIENNKEQSDPSHRYAFNIPTGDLDLDSSRRLDQSDKVRKGRACDVTEL